MRIACLLAALAVMSPHAWAEIDGASLQEQVDALAQQIELRYASFPVGYTAKRDSVRAVLAEWNSAEQSAFENRELIDGWLAAALRSVMPGGSGVLPAAPTFAATAPTLSEGPQLSGPTPSSVSPAIAPSQAVPSRSPQPIAAADQPELSAVSKSPQRAPAQPIAASPRTQRSVSKPVVAEPPAQSARSNWSRHPAAAPLEWRDPFRDDRAASPNPLRAGSRREARRPAFRSATTRVNVDQLKAQIRGYNAALRELQATVMRIDEIDVFALADAAEELQRLDEQRAFLDLYRAGLDAVERRSLPESPSAELVRELVRRKARTLSQQTPADEGAQRRALERLHARLASND